MAHTDRVLAATEMATNDPCLIEAFLLIIPM